jgi:hypothetical protein
VVKLCGACSTQFVQKYGTVLIAVTGTDQELSPLDDDDDDDDSIE